MLLIGGLLVPVTLGMAYPYYLAAKRRLFVDNSSYGDKQLRLLRHARATTTLPR